MNDYYSQYKYMLKQQWQSMDLLSKGFALLICFILLFSGLFTGLFVFSASLIITLALYLKSLLINPVTENTEFRLR